MKVLIALFQTIKAGTTVADRWLMLLSAMGILLLGFNLTSTPGARAGIFRDGKRVMTLMLNRSQTITVEGRLGPVEIDVDGDNGRIRLREYLSPRMIGTRSGWISSRGQAVACVPCGILIQVEGDAATPDYDAMAR